VDTHDSPYSNDREERERVIAHSKKWIDVAVTLGSPSVRTNIARAKDAKPDVDRIAERLQQVVAYASSKNIVVHLENDDPVNEDPFLLVRVVKQGDSHGCACFPISATRWLHRTRTITTGHSILCFGTPTAFAT
jgi:sugar phosphate isomerase/epimerase